MDITPFLKFMVEKNASDLFFSVGAHVNIKVEGVTASIGKTALKPGMVKQIAYSLMSDDQIRVFEETMESNLLVALEGIGRFRANVYRQRGDVAMVIRYIKDQIPSVEALGLPLILEKLIMELQGLVLLVGGTGAGKSTSLAAMINYRNECSTGHILTIEDPVEYLHEHKRSVVDQREIGLDTLSHENALKNAMREAPDVIFIGEIRERKTMQHAIAYGETGHLCLSTLHANNANQALDRIVNFFPDTARYQLLNDLSLNLRAIVSQRLIPGINGGRFPAVEVLLNTPHIASLIAKGEVSEIKEVMERNLDLGMQTFDQALIHLYQAGKISKENALCYADSRNNVNLKIRLAEESGSQKDEQLSITEENIDNLR